MKKFILTNLLFICLVAFATAQETETKPWYVPSIGVRGGVNISCKPKDFDEWYWKTGANFGVTADFRLGEEWIFRPGVYYTMKGYKTGDIYHEIDQKMKYNYLEFPILFVHQIDICNNCNFELQLGAYFARGINSWVYDYHKRFDWGLNFGLGFNFYRFYLGGSYDFGVMSPYHRGLNQCIMINTGYVFN